MSWVTLTIFTVAVVGAYLLADYMDEMDESERRHLYNPVAKR